MSWVVIKIICLCLWIFNLYNWYRVPNEMRTIRWYIFLFIGWFFATYELVTLGIIFTRYLTK